MTLPFYLCARQGASTWRCKSSIGPTGGTVSRTARVSIARWNLKEAAGKALGSIDLDRELDRRGHTYCRYADDCNVYVGSKRAGDRVMASIEGFLNRRLRLRINRDKSAVARPWKRVFLGYTMTWHKRPRLKVA